jgi:hypothetical protein
MNTPCTRVATRKRWAQADKSSRYSSYFYQSVSIRGKTAIDFIHFENFICT